jgi:Cu-Zn family superoxide dismutase
VNHSGRHVAVPIGLALVVMLTWVTDVAAAGERAAAELRDSQGQVVGIAVFTQDETAVRLVVEVRNLPPGFHGIHIHAVGLCDPPDFTSAGPHFNPLNRQHGLENPEGPHAGDLPNLLVAADGTATFQAITDRVTLTPGPTSLFDEDGSALVIHAGSDDQKTDPSGESGARLACGVIRSAGSEPIQEGGIPLSLILTALFALLLILILSRVLT